MGMAGAMRVIFQRAASARQTGHCTGLPAIAHLSGMELGRSRSPSSACSDTTDVPDLNDVAELRFEFEHLPAASPRLPGLAHNADGPSAEEKRQQEGAHMRRALLAESRGRTVD